MTNLLRPAPDELFFDRKDPSDPRLGTLVKSDNEAFTSSSPASNLDANLGGANLYLLGYPDDEGIQINGGRPGASEAPNKIRQYLYKMTPPLERALPSFFDLGNITTSAPLADRHEQSAQLIHSLLDQEHRIITLGGGHDYGYPDGAGFLRHHRAKNNQLRPLVINFDAHLDVRPTDRGLSSGTPFFRLLNEFEDFDFIEIGIQPQCNSQIHLQWATSKGAKILRHDHFLLSGRSFVEYALEQISTWIFKSRPTFVSIDIDAFSSAYAMGCSQSWPSGLTPMEFKPLFEVLLSRLNVQVLGIYEVSPPLDLDDRTSKLAAEIIFQYLSVGP